jgi:hypothetical protein
VGGLIEMFIVVDAEGSPGRLQVAPAPPIWGVKEACRHAGEDHERRKAVEVRHAHAARISGNFRVVPLNGESDRRVAEHAEIVAVVRVLRDPLAGKDQVAPESLLQASVEFIAKAGTQRIRQADSGNREEAGSVQHCCIRCWKAPDFR